MKVSLQQTTRSSLWSSNLRVRSIIGPVLRMHPESINTGFKTLYCGILGFKLKSRADHLMPADGEQQFMQRTGNLITNSLMYTKGPSKVFVEVTTSKPKGALKGFVLSVFPAAPGHSLREEIDLFIEEIVNSQKDFSAERIEYPIFPGLKGVRVADYEFYFEPFSASPPSKKPTKKTSKKLGSFFSSFFSLINKPYSFFHRKTSGINSFYFHHIAPFCRTLEQAKELEAFFKVAFKAQPDESYIFPIDKAFPHGISLRVNSFRSKYILANTITLVHPESCESLSTGHPQAELYKNLLKGYDPYGHVASGIGLLPEFLEIYSRMKNLKLTALIRQARNLKNLPQNHSIIMSASKAGLTSTTRRDFEFARDRKNPVRLQFFTSFKGGSKLFEGIYENDNKIPFSPAGGRSALESIETATEKN